jgi:outer membrane protein OmpA-like peptidoglycan-associated protein
MYLLTVEHPVNLDFRFTKSFCILCVILTLQLLPVSIHAQQNLTLYHMNAVNQSMYSNTTSQPITNINVGIPIFSNLYTGVSNSGFRYKDLIYKRADDSLTLDIGNALSKMRDNNYLSMQFQTDILSVGFRIGKSYINLSSSENIHFRLKYTKDFIGFAWNGNGPSLGKELAFDPSFDFTHYRDYSLHLIQRVTKKLILGFKFKYLYGMENINTARSEVRLQTDARTFDLSGRSDVEINTAGLTEGIFGREFDINNYALKRKNTGYAFDAGASYRFTDKLTVSASAVDLGGINWKDYLRTYKTANPETVYKFQGTDIRSLINDSTSINEAANKTLDSLFGDFRIDSIRQEYRSRLTPKLYLGASYELSEMFVPAVLIYSEIFDNSVIPGFALSMNMHLARMLHATVSWSGFNRDFSRVGLGISINTWKGSQFFIISDNLPGLIWPQSAKSADFRFGINLRFGKDPYRDDEDEDGVLDQDDRCPRQAGPPELKGCPDKDGDKVPDSQDQCPDEFGVAKFQGCPDRDGDGVIDGLDKCPDFPGVTRFKGCPDKDKDGVMDSEDLCPDLAGSVEFSGCPDTDGDGIQDSEDSCPKQFGTRENKGCPNDKDSDGVPDLEDKCPEEAGLPENLGCPDKDTDRDGVTDRLDKCPQTPGSPATNGCPEISTEIKFTLDQVEKKLIFEDGKDIIKSESYSSLDDLGNLLKQHPEWNVSIENHVSASEGNDSFTMSLSKDRAQAVKSYLMNRGVDESRVKTEYFGAKQPLGDDNSPEGKRQNNRTRVQILFR